MADTATRTYLAKFSLPDATDDMQLGMTATLTLADADQQRVARVPLSALFSQGDGASLYVVDRETGAVKLQPVTVKSYGTKRRRHHRWRRRRRAVVALGVQKLDPAQKVRVVAALSF